MPGSVHVLIYLSFYYYYLYFRSYELTRITQIVTEPGFEVRQSSSKVLDLTHCPQRPSHPLIHIVSTLHLLPSGYTLDFLQPSHSGEGEMKEGAWDSPTHLLWNVLLAKAEALGFPESSLSWGMGSAEQGVGTYPSPGGWENLGRLRTVSKLKSQQ